MSTTTRAATRTAPEAGTWAFDPAHSDLRIIARHLMVTKVRGTFAEIEGAIEVADDPADSSARFEAKAASVTTSVPDRDEHLRSADFLDAENHPSVVFESTNLSAKGSNWELEGDLTIKGTTKPVVFDLTFEGEATDPYGNQKAAFMATGEIDREQFGLTWNVPLEGGGVLVSKNFKIEFDVQAVRQS